MGYCICPAKSHLTQKPTRCWRATFDNKPNVHWKTSREFWKLGDRNLHHVIKTTVFLKDMNEFAQMNEVYAPVFHRGSAGALYRASGTLTQGCFSRNRSDRSDLSGPTRGYCSCFVERKRTGRSR